MSTALPDSTTPPWWMHGWILIDHGNSYYAWCHRPSPRWVYGDRFLDRTHRLMRKGSDMRDHATYPVGVWRRKP